MGLAQILPLTDEDAGAGSRVISATIADPFVVVIRANGGTTVLWSDESGDIEELEQTPALASTKWKSASLYEDIDDVFRLEYGDGEEISNVLMFLLSQSGGLHVSSLTWTILPARLTATGISSA